MKTYSQFHDGFLEGLRIDKDEKVVQVYLSTLKEERTIAVLTGVLMLKADRFREGNIILDVSTRDPKEIILADIAELYELDSSHEPADWEHTLMDKVRSQRLQLFRVNPSYGGTCVILAQTIEFVPNHPHD
jgi:hypothetical protein